MNIVRTKNSVVKLDGLLAAAVECNNVRLYYVGGDTLTVNDDELLAALILTLNKSSVGDDADEFVGRKSRDGLAISSEKGDLTIRGEME